MSTASDKWVRRIATWLPRLARAGDARAAAEALFNMTCEIPAAVEASEQLEAADESHLWLYARAVEEIEDLDRLVDAWAHRLVEVLREAHDAQQRWSEAVRSEGEDLPEFDIVGPIVGSQLVLALRAVGDRIDPHLDTLVAAIGSIDRDADERLAEAMLNAGPGIVAAAPALLEVMRRHGMWCWPSRIAGALARAAEFDDSIVPQLRKMLSSGDAQQREAAAQVLGELGDRGRAAEDDLLAMGEQDRSRLSLVISTLARIDARDERALALIERSFSDEDGNVRQAAVYAAGELGVDPDRFVPLLLAACDHAAHLPDEDLPETAVRALGNYGPAAGAAVDRLRRFLEGPMVERTVEADVVAEALERITGATAASVAVSQAVRRGAPVSRDEPLFAVTHGNRQCYIDRDGTLIIETEFEWGEEFHDGRAIVHGDDRTAVLDRTGRIVFESEWDDIKPFHEGLAAVSRDEKWGFVDHEGRLVIAPEYDSVTRFSEGLAGVETGRTTTDLGSMVTLDRPGRRGFVDRQGNVVVDLVHDDVQPFSDGRALVCTGSTLKPNPLLDGKPVPSDRKYGYMDRTGAVVIDGNYDMAMPFSEGLAGVGRGQWLRRERHGYVDPAGNEVIPLGFTSAGAFREGLAIVRRRGKRWRGVQFVIDRAGNVLLETRLMLHGEFSDGLVVAWIDGAWGAIDATGRIVIKPEYDSFEPFRDGLAAVQRGDWYCLLNREGRLVWGPSREACGADGLIESEWAD